LTKHLDDLRFILFFEFIVTCTPSQNLIKQVVKIINVMLIVWINQQVEIAFLNSNKARFGNLIILMG